jgi:hypothetical protein
MQNLNLEWFLIDFTDFYGNQSVIPVTSGFQDYTGFSILRSYAYALGQEHWD